MLNKTLRIPSSNVTFLIFTLALSLNSSLNALLAIYVWPNGSKPETFSVSASGFFSCLMTNVPLALYTEISDFL